jgi:TusE/DsrC/DsvC family sulfur relay protein
MLTATYAGRTVQTDDQGFLANPKEWTREMGEAIAREAGITLTPAHWKVIDFARSDFAERGEAPGPRRITARTGVTTRELYALFPKGPGKLAARIAGIPKPKTCL